MRLVVLYGPPGAGKLSIARELAQLTSLKLLDNHLFFNIAIRLYERFSEPLEQLYDLLHLVTLKDALRNDISGRLSNISSVNFIIFNKFFSIGHIQIV